MADSPAKSLDAFTVPDLEAVRILLRGDSVIDWHRLNFSSVEEVHTFLRVHELNPDSSTDRSHVAGVQRDAIAYLRRHFDYPIPRPVEELGFDDLCLLASGRGHRQMCACAILKCMHIIHHLQGRELLFGLPLSHQEVYQLVEQKVYRVLGGMLASGFPITEFMGGRKEKDSLYTKLLSKQDTIAAEIYDKLRFRVVTRERDDIFPVLQHMTQELVPFNYVIPGQSISSIFGFRTYCESHPHLAGMLPAMQARPDADLLASDNVFSGQSYRVIHFVVDMPVRVPDSVLARGLKGQASLGPVVFVVCEFQLIDRATEASNELGDASHDLYKERQKKAVVRRLQIGFRDDSAPASSVAPASPTGPMSGK